MTKIEWTPCDVALPTESGYYVVTKKLFKGVKPFVTKEYYMTSRGWTGDGDGYSILAWAPKIEPYKPERKKV